VVAQPGRLGRREVVLDGGAPSPHVNVRSRC
jgi:hypothetical protein